MQNGDTEKNTSLRLSLELHARLKAACAMRGVSMKDALLEAVENWIGREPVKTHAADPSVRKLEELLGGGGEHADLTREFVAVMWKRRRKAGQ